MDDRQRADNADLNATMARYRAMLAATYERAGRIEAALRDGNRVKAAYIQWAWVHRN